MKKHKSFNTHVNIQFLSGMMFFDLISILRSSKPEGSHKVFMSFDGDDEERLYAPLLAVSFSLVGDEVRLCFGSGVKDPLEAKEVASFSHLFRHISSVKPWTKISDLCLMGGVLEKMTLDQTCQIELIEV